MPKILAVTDEMERRASGIGSNADDILKIQNAVTKIGRASCRERV